MEREPVDISVSDGDSAVETEVMVVETPLEQVEPIKRSRALSVESIEDLNEIIEAPLLKACQLLYQRHIPTYESSANREHIRYKYPTAAHISIVGDGLSEENLAIVDGMIAEGNRYGYVVALHDPASYEPLYRVMITFDVPMEEKITLEGIERKSVHFAERFVENPEIKLLDSEEIINIEV